MLEADVESFSGRKAVEYPKIAQAIPKILEAAFERCGLSGVWDAQQARETAGDSYAAVFPTAFLPHLLNPFLGALQDELDDREQIGAKPAGLRMRVSVTVGPITDAGPNATGTGAARVELNRLLNCRPVRDALINSGPSTRVAAVVSARAYEDAVLSGYSKEDEDLYQQVEVENKNYRRIAYLRVPRLSWDALGKGVPLAELPESAATEVPKSAVGARHSTNIANGSTADTLLQIGFNEGGVNTGQQHTYNTGRDSYHHSGSGPQFNRGDVKRYEDRRGERREP
ncbi:hypothetical protein Amir_3720 [Actinosynnema mirum DSM 43827]|uniref:Uncharacterized protein n=2 Tax=Actinosynnema mirum TaxID=40567 RepID=C6WCY4_ACTMD|nr:hypothetical protein Amir_3720 [Actinosynnema mirum DSM 43827]